MIAAHNVVKSVRVGFWLKKLDILKSVSFQIERGSTHGLLGPNGAGKTSIIHLLVGIRSPDSGSITINGEDPTNARIKSKIGYLPERPLFQEYLTGRTLLKYYATLSDISRNEVDSLVKRSLERVGIAHAGDNLIKTYSKGMLQRLGIAQAILHRPEILILDEPMSGLDPVGRKEMRDLISSFAKEGTTILFSSHVIPDVEALCDSITVIDHGKVTADGKIAEILSRYSSKTEIRFNLSSKTSLKTDALERTASGYRWVLDSNTELNAKLKTLVDDGAQIESVIPIRPSLEEVFFK